MTSAASLAAGQYYGHKQNQFWRILAVPLVGMSYADRQEELHRTGIAIWDVYAGCERAGSLDSAIRNPQVNDFGRLRHNCNVCASTARQRGALRAP